MSPSSLLRPSKRPQMVNERKTLKILIVAGEDSGDLHGANLIQAFSKQRPGTRFWGMGGARMRKAGAETVFDIEKTGTVGVVEILGELSHYLDIYRTLTKAIRREKFDAAVLIDYPTLNLRLAKHCKKAGFPVYYFISPQIWAWREGRMKTIRQRVDKMLVALPFEEPMYKKAGVDAEFLGHPFVDHVKPSQSREETFREFSLDPQKKTVGLFPGSRMNEIDSLLRVMLDAAEKIRVGIPECQFVLAVADSINPQTILDRLGTNSLKVKLVGGKNYDVMNCADFLIVASGSATLEAGLMERPMVIAYKLKPFTYWLAKRLVKTRMIGLVNIVAGEPVVKELIQDQVTPENIAREALGILRNPERDQTVRAKLRPLRDKLGQPGVMNRIAESILRSLDSNPGHEKNSF